MSNEERESNECVEYSSNNVHVYMFVYFFKCVRALCEVREIYAREGWNLEVSEM